MDAKNHRSEVGGPPAFTLTVDVPAFRGRSSGYVSALLVDALLAEVQSLTLDEASAVVSSALFGSSAPRVSVHGKSVELTTLEFIPPLGSLVIRVWGALDRAEVGRAHFTISVVSRALIILKGGS